MEHNQNTVVIYPNLHHAMCYKTQWQLPQNINRTQAIEITPRQRRNGPVSCCVTLFATRVYHSYAAWWDCTAHFLSLVTLTFDPWPPHSNLSEQGTKHVFSVNLAQIRLAAPEIFDSQTKWKSHRQAKQQLSSCWDGRPFGHNRHGPKVGRGCCGGLGPHLTQCGVGWGLPLYQVASWSIQPFGHNCRNVTLLRVAIRLRTIFIASLVVKTFTGCVHWVIARYQLTQVNNVLELSGKRSKLWEIYTLISPLYFTLPPTLRPYFLILSRF